MQNQIIGRAHDRGHFAVRKTKNLSFKNFHTKYRKKIEKIKK